MAAHAEPLLRHIHRLVSRPNADPSSDAVLLERFVSRGDESAFAALLARHGPMVFGVCRRVLRDAHEAEDAFQATFLVLARKAGSLRRPETLAAFLYGTARRLALASRRAGARRRQREQGAVLPASSVDPLDELSARELFLALDEEMARLPETYRLPLLLCGLEGRSQEEAARLLGWTPGSVKGRLERGRARLHARLLRRGLAFSAALLALGVAQGGSASAAGRLTATTLRAAMAFTEGDRGAIAASVLALADSGIAPMMATKMKLGLVLLLTTSVLAGAGTLATKQPPTAPSEPEKPAAQRAAQPATAVDKRSGVDLYGDPLPPSAIARMGTMRFRHIDTVISVAYSPDGKIIASGQRNRGPIILWDAARGKELRRIEEEPGVLGGFAFSPDGKQLALAKWGEWIGLWDVATGKQVRRLKVRSGGSGGCVAFSGDGKVLATPLGPAVALLDIRTGAELRRLKGHPEDVESIAFSPDGKTLAAGGGSKTIVLWDTATGKQLRQLTGHEKRIPSVAFCADGKLLASASHDRTARLWDVATGREQRRFTHQERDDDAIQTVHFVPGHPWLITGGLRSIRVWDLPTGKEVRRFPGHFCGCDCPVALSTDGTKLIARGGEEGQIRLWNLATGKRLCPPGGHQRAIGSVAFSADGKTLATGSWDETLRLWDTASGKELHRFSLTFGVHVVFMPDGKTLAGGSDDGFLHFWDVATGKELRRYLARKGGFSCLVFATDGKTFVSSGVNRMVWAADGKTLIPATKDKGINAIHLCRADTGAEIRRFEGHREAVAGLALAPDVKTLASVSSDKTARLWDVATGKEIRQLCGHQDGLSCIVYSPNGKMVAAAGADTVIHLWDVATGEEVRRFVGHQSFIDAVRFSPDGRMLASASHDRIVRLWEVSTGQERQRFEGHRNSVFALGFSHDGRQLASGSLDATALVWDVTGRINAEREGATRLSEKELTRLWNDLGDEKNATRAYQAMCALLRDPARTMRLFREQLHPVPATDTTRTAQWIADLDSGEFSVREKGMRELAQRGEAVEGALRKVLEDRPSLEVRQRIKLLLEKLKEADRLRALRAVEVLEHLGTTESRRLLETLAQGTAGARRTEEAKAALERLARRPRAGT